VHLVRTYWTLLRLPGAAGFAGAGFVARLPIAMRSVGCVLMVSALTGSFTLAGAVAGVLTLSQAAIAPIVGRLVDQRGQYRIIMTALPVNILGTVALALLARYEAAWPFGGQQLCRRTDRRDRQVEGRTGTATPGRHDGFGGRHDSPGVRGLHSGDRRDHFAWLSSAITIGMAFGSAASGWLVDLGGSTASLSLAIGCANVGFVATVAGIRAMSRHQRECHVAAMTR